jgi:hypothetical protein
MKKKVKMTCILKSGVKVEDSIEADANNTFVANTIRELQRGLEDNVGNQETKASNFTFGTTTIAISEIAAISFKEN